MSFIHRLCTSSCHPSIGFGWTWPHRLPYENPDRERLLFHHNSWERNCQGHQGKAVLCRSWFWTGNGHSRILFFPWKVLWATWRTSDHHWQWEVQVSRGSLPTFIPRHGVVWYSWNHLQLDHEVRCWHQEGPLCQHCSLRRHHHVPWHCWPHAEGNHRTGSVHHENQDHCTPWEKVLSLDWRIHPCFLVHIPTDVDLQAGIWWVWTLHCAQEMLLNWLWVFEQQTIV